ncbi:MAG: glycosyltransferase [Candidatus Beckwithbacteria bacterium]|nr:glycosyltransferase [Candidatus Beckwithbacteria bacterium]
MIKNLAKRIIYVSSYIPRHCGIATYTKNLTNAVNLLNPYHLAKIIAVNRGQESLDYPKEVKFVLNHLQPHDYLKAAEFINHSGADLVSLQHEFGLFGGQCGDYLLPFINALKLPLVTTIHSLSDDPRSRHGLILKKIIAKSQAVTVMINQSRQKLVKDYGIPTQKIVVIPHGIPDLAYCSTDKYKRKKKLAKRLILGNINLITQSKGIEYSLKAVAIIKQHLPQVLYLVIGKTHPVVLQRDGEAYRQSLKKMIKQLGIRDNVKFINQYLSLEKLILWLRTIDIYVTPYLSPQQSASGALSYALGAGKFCISTPYLYAREVLSHNRGILVPFRNYQALAQKVIYYWQNPKQRQEIEKNAYSLGRLMTWPNVALQHLNLFKLIINRHKALIAF